MLHFEKFIESEIRFTEIDIAKAILNDILFYGNLYRLFSLSFIIPLLNFLCVLHKYFIIL